MVDSPRTKPRKRFFTDPRFKSSAGHCQCHHVIFNQQTTSGGEKKTLSKDSIYIFVHNFIPPISFFLIYTAFLTFSNTILNQE